MSKEDKKKYTLLGFPLVFWFILFVFLSYYISTFSKKDEDKKIMLESPKPTTPEMEKETKKNQQTIRPFDKIKSH